MNIGIIGFGRFGQLLAKILKKSHNIKVYDRKNKASDAKKLGVEWGLCAEVCNQDLIILCVPISEMDKVLRRIKNKIKKHSIVMDTCSVKEYPAKLMLKHLPRCTEIIASHPMFGPDSAKYGLKGLQIVFCPQRVKKKNLNKIKNIFSEIGLETIQITPQEHDKQSAFSLCLVHFLGRGLEKVGITAQKITTMGFEHLLKVQETVTNDTMQLFKDMQTYNRFAKPLRKKLIQMLQNIHQSIDKH